MIGFDEARELVLSRVIRLPAEACLLERACGRALAEDVVASVSNPPFDASAMDGYALRLEEVKAPLPISQVVAAGAVPAPLLPGTAARIFTGGIVPEGADTVVAQEDCESDGEVVRIDRAPRVGANIRPKGDDFWKGDLLVPGSSEVNPQILSLLASNGQAACQVFARPRVAIVSTGAELAQPGHALEPGQIYDSGSCGLRAAAECSGAEIRMVGSVGDELAATTRELAAGLAESDVLLSTGGVSVGDTDLVRRVYSQLGVESVFWKVDMKPGKPIFFGVAGPKLVFGLPGNPVSALVGFYLFVRPALRKMQGLEVEDYKRIRWAGEPRRRHSSRTEWLRVAVKNETAVPLEGQGSHQVHALAQANGLARVAPGAGELRSGNEVQVLPI